MRTALAALLLLGSLPARADPASEVKALIDKQVEAWNKGDLETFCGVYADDAVFISPSGMTRGRTEVLARYRKRYPDAASRGVLSLEPLDVREGGGTVSVGARWTIKRKDQNLTGMTLIVLHRTPTGYRIVQDASM